MKNLSVKFLDDFSEVQKDMPIGQLIMEIRGCQLLLANCIDKELFDIFFKHQIIRGKRLISLSTSFLAKRDKYSIDLKKWQQDLKFNLQGFASILDSCSYLLRSSFQCHNQ